MNIYSKRINRKKYLILVAFKNTSMYVELKFRAISKNKEYIVSEVGVFGLLNKVLNLSLVN